MELLLLSSFPPPAGGISTWTEEFLKFMTKKSLSIDTIDTGVIGKRKTEIKSDRNIFDEITRAYIIIKALIYNLKKKKYDLVHINYSCGKYNSFIYVVFIKIIRVFSKKSKIVVMYHCNLIDLESGLFNNIDRFHLFFLKILYKSCDLNIVLNNISYNHIKVQANVPSLVLPNFINKNFIKQKINFKPVARNIVFIGHAVKLKGLAVLLETAKKLPMLNFHIVGPITSEMPTDSIPENIIIKGELEFKAVLDYFDHMDVFFLPTLSEGFSMAILEAMANGMPIITTKVGANIEMLEYSGGILVDKITAPNMIDALKFLTNNSTLRKKMSQWNTNKVLNHYTTEIVLMNLLGIYNKISDKRK
jgi:L-malate glycosyltransferase